MKLELGGSGADGKYARGDGWTNIDISATADVVHDLNATPWPIEADTVDAVYSSHCLEHLDCPFAVLNELVRICRVGADIEIRVPHPASQMAMVAGHKHVFSPLQAINVDRHFPENFWKERKRLKLEGIDYAPTLLLEEAKQELPFLRGVDNRAIMRWIPGTCHESRFHYRCVENEYYSH